MGRLFNESKSNLSDLYIQGGNDSTNFMAPTLDQSIKMTEDNSVRRVTRHQRKEAKK